MEHETFSLFYTVTWNGPELPSLNLKLMVPGATIFVVSER
jgi:hypothetical protein